MADDDIAAGASDRRSPVSVPRPLKRWRVFVFGRRAATTRVRELPGDQWAGMMPDRRLEMSDGPEPKAAPAD
jgi:hypothetical protein